MADFGPPRHSGIFLAYPVDYGVTAGREIFRQSSTHHGNATPSPSGRSRKRRCQMPCSRRAMRTLERYSPDCNRRQNPDLIRPHRPALSLSPSGKRHTQCRCSGSTTIAITSKGCASQAARNDARRSSTCSMRKRRRRSSRLTVKNNVPAAHIRDHSKACSSMSTRAIRRHQKSRSTHRNFHRCMHQPHKVRRECALRGLGPNRAHRHAGAVGLQTPFILDISIESIAALTILSKKSSPDIFNRHSK